MVRLNQEHNKLIVFSQIKRGKTLRDFFDPSNGPNLKWQKGSRYSQPISN